MNLMEQRAALLNECDTVAQAAKSADRDLTQEELDSINERLDQVKGIDDKIVRAKDGSAILAKLGALTAASKGTTDDVNDDAAARNLGAHYIKFAANRLAEVKGTRFSVGAPEFKAATDPQSIAGLGVPQFDTTVTEGFRRQAVAADLLGSGTLSGSSLTYYVEGTAEGAPATSAELAAKAQLHYNYSTVTEALSKIAGFVKVSDEMLEDLDFLVSEINGRLVYDLSIAEDNQLLNGSGTAPDLRGILNRSGVLTVAAPATAADNADNVFKGAMAVWNATGLSADGVIINPADYQTIRLAKDVNGQYYGGGPFTGTYGQNGVVFQPPLWGLRTVVSTAVAAKTVLVGAFAQSGTVYRKGGVRVESTNSDQDDFVKNRITIRAEERIALAIRRPNGFAKVTLL